MYSAAIAGAAHTPKRPRIGTRLWLGRHAINLSQGSQFYSCIVEMEGVALPWPLRRKPSDVISFIKWAGGTHVLGLLVVRRAYRILDQRPTCVAWHKGKEQNEKEKLEKKRKIICVRIGERPIHG